MLRARPWVAAAVVAGSVLLTIGILAAVDAMTGSDDARPVAKRRPDVISLDDIKPRKRAPGPAAERDERDRRSRSRTPIERLVGAKVIARMDGSTATPDLIARARRGQIGGVITFPGAAGSTGGLRESIDRLQAAARDGGGPGLLVFTDQEGGPVKRYPGGPPGRSPNELGAAGDTDAAAQEGQQTGRFLAGLGINVDLAPVLDVPSVPGAFIESRAFGRSAGRVGSLGVAFASGLQSAGVAATAKHFPGLGSTTENTDLQRSVIDAPADQLETELQPFEDAVGAGVALTMVSSAVYPAYDDRMPAVLSPAVVREQLRRRVGFTGVAITDDLESPAIAAVMPAPRAAVAAARAGIDMVMFAKSAGGSAAGYDALVAAARSGELGRGRLEGSYDRIRSLASNLAP